MRCYAWIDLHMLPTTDGSSVMEQTGCCLRSSCGSDFSVIHTVLESCRDMVQDVAEEFTYEPIVTGWSMD